jgi:diaminohydroxyphosphoribosylaminopyrimidine deaminase/5-amino-6-(5-phosphoribosylamino)uracil reductase
VLVEAGATLSTAFLQEGLVDEMISYVAPTLLVNLHVPCSMLILNRWQSNFVLSFDVTQLGQDIRLRLLPIQEMI